MIKTLRKLGIENFLKLMKSIYQKPTADIVLNDERRNAKIGGLKKIKTQAEPNTYVRKEN